MVNTIIFDMDGLMIDSEKTFLDSALAVCQRDGINISREYFISTMGMNLKLMQEKMNKEHPEVDFDSFFNSYLNYRLTYEKTNPPAIKKGLYELISFAKRQNLKLAIATSTYKERALEILANSKIDASLFDYIMTGDQVFHSKPHPEIYLKTLEKLGITSKEAIIFEDSRNGLLSALAANIPCVVVPDIAIIEPEVLSNAYKVIPDLEKGIAIINQLNHKASQ